MFLPLIFVAAVAPPMLPSRKTTATTRTVSTVFERVLGVPAMGIRPLFVRMVVEP